MFFIFWTLLLKMYLFEIATFFVALYFSSQLNFVRGSSSVKDSCFDEVYFPLCNCCYDNWNSLFFPISIATIVKEKNSFNTPIRQCIWLPNLAAWYCYLDQLQPIKSLNPFITWSCKITWQTKTIISLWHTWRVPTHKVTWSFDHMVW